MMRDPRRRCSTRSMRRLAAEFDPEQIILFGSHAWGTPTEDSDIDLLVIVPRASAAHPDGRRVLTVACEVCWRRWTSSSRRARR